MPSTTKQTPPTAITVIATDKVLWLPVPVADPPGLSAVPFRCGDGGGGGGGSGGGLRWQAPTVASSPGAQGTLLAHSTAASESPVELARLELHLSKTAGY